MAGHSHSSNIKFRKDRVDAKRARLFAKLSRMITVAARHGGSIDANPRLRLAVDKARVVSMSKDAIERAIKKGTGETDTGGFEELQYEGYGPGGVAVLLEILTDKRSRTAPEIRKLFEDHGGNLAANGAVSWMFERAGICTVDPASRLDEEQLLERALDCGADDLVRVDGAYSIHCAPGALASVRTALERAQVPLVGSELVYRAAQRVQVTDPATGRRVASLLDALDEHDDVQAVHSNEEFSDEVARVLREES